MHQNILSTYRKKNNFKKQSLIGYVVFLLQFCFSQDFSADSLIVTHNVSIIEKSTIKLIKKWQNISYSSEKLNCQFYPSCSNYFSHSVAIEGIVIGSIIGFDRIIRCNPAAVGYHLRYPNAEFHTDGRLVDRLELPKTNPLKKTSKLPIILSVIPGLGRAYYGHKFDGIVSFTYVSGLSSISYNSFKNENRVMGLFSGFFALLFWSADVYATNQLSLKLKK